jgi:D-alanine-D-alanine ligase
LTLDLASARWRLEQLQPALVFNLVESLAGRGCYIHLAPILLEELGLPFTGAAAQATYSTSNKLAAKQLLQLAGIPTPPWLTAPTSEGIDAGAGPWLVKSVWEHASIGLDDASLVTTPARLAHKIATKKTRFGGDWFTERYIEGREFNLALLEGPEGFEVLAPAETLFQDYPADKPRIVNYAAKWDAASFEYHHTPRRFDFPSEDLALIASLKDLALRCAELFQLRGYARVDFRVDREGRPWVLEVNTNPCLSPDAGFAAAAAQAGLPLAAVIERIIQTALASWVRHWRCAAN